MVTINEIDLDGYPDVKRITADDAPGYLLEGNRNRLIENDAAFDALLLRSHVADINQMHLDFYPMGEPVWVTPAACRRGTPCWGRFRVRKFFDLRALCLLI